MRTMAKYALVVDQWLRRTGACDVDIFVHELGNHVASWCTDDMFELLIKRVPQWRSVSLHCSAYTVQRFCYMLGQSSFSEELSFPRLEHFDINISGEYYQQDDLQEEYNNASHLLNALLNSIHLASPSDNNETAEDDSRAALCRRIYISEYSKRLRPPVTWHSSV